MFKTSSLIQTKSVGSGRKFVINLDIGDTYSCFSFVKQAEFRDTAWKVEMNDPWNRDRERTYKTCSTILLAPDGKFGTAKYGYEAESEYQEKYLDGEHEGYYLFRNIKKEFYKHGVTYETSIEDHNGGKKMPLCTVTLHLFTFFKDQAQRRLRQMVDDVTEEEIFWVIAVPSAWRQETVMLFRDLFLECGVYYRRLCVVTEPEACLAYTMQYLKTQVKPRKLDKITPVISHFDARVLVLDLSGDATTISVHRVSGDKTFKMVYQSRSHRKGSSQVNKQFHLFLSNLVGEDIIRTMENDYKDDYLTMQNEFEMRKRKIDGESPDKAFFAFKLPYQIEETFKETYGTEFKSIEQRIKEASSYRDKVSYKDSRLKVENDVLRELFDVVLDQITVYIRNTLHMLPCARVASFVLVGGFSQSTIVQKGIRKRFPEMQVIVPENPELAITKGAVMMAMLDNVTPPVPKSGRYTRPVDPNASTIDNIVSTVCTIS